MSKMSTPAGRLPPYLLQVMDMGAGVVKTESEGIDTTHNLLSVFSSMSKDEREDFMVKMGWESYTPNLVWT